nr:hypothetical protein [Tanacetum cinerariifolium]
AKEEVATDVVPPTPTSPSPSSPVIPSSPPHQSPCPSQPQDAEGSSHVFQQVLDTCSALVLRVEGLKNANAAQQLEIITLKARVKKLEKLNKRMYSISVDMETDEGVVLVVDQEKDVEIEGRHADKQAEIYNIDFDHSSKVLSMQEDDTEVQEAVEVINTAKLITKVVTVAATQVVAASTHISAAKPKILKIADAPTVSTRKRKGVVIRDSKEELHIDTPAETLTRYHGIKKKPQFESEARKNMISYLKNTEGVNTPRSDEDRLKLMELMVFVLKKGVCDEIELNAARLSKFLLLAVVKRSGDVTRLQALVDKKRIVIIEEVIREILQLNDAEGVICLPNDEIFAGLARMRVGKGFSGVETPLFETMLTVRDVAKEAEAQILAQGDDVQEHAKEEVATDVVPPTPTSPSPSSPVIPSSPPHQSPCPSQPQDAEGSSHVFQQVLDTCSALVLRVEGLKNANAAQQLEIITLKARVKKLEKLNKRMYSISVDMETDEGVVLVVDQEKDVEIEGRHADKQAEIYNIDFDHSSK